MVPHLLNRRLVRSSNPLAALILLFVWAGAAYAQSDSALDGVDEPDVSAPDADTTDGPLEGHSYHGETFNEGPRQAAYLMGTTGRVHMKIATEFDEVQRYFDQGVGQLHGFWYLEAERSFRHAAAIDPGLRHALLGHGDGQREQPRARARVHQGSDRSEGRT